MHIQTIPILLILFFQLLSPAWHTEEPFPENQAAAVTSRLSLAYSEEEPAKDAAQGELDFSDEEEEKEDDPEEIKKYEEELEKYL